MKIVKGLLLVLIAAATVSCEENEITYDTTPVEGKAEFQLHYFVPVVSGAANNIFRVEINGEMVANNTAPLNTYNAIPSGLVSTFYAVEPGTVNIKLYKGPNEELAYDQDTQLAVGKQNVFVHDFDEPPVVLDNEYPYANNVTADTDSATWVKFYNFLYETSGTPTPLILQYQYLDPRTGQPINVGGPVRFGESTGWVEVKVLKDVFKSAGTRRVDYRILVKDDAGNVVGPLQQMNSVGDMVDYADWWTGTIGRKVHHIYGGIRTETPIASVRQFTAN